MNEAGSHREIRLIHYRQSGASLDVRLGSCNRTNALYPHPSSEEKLRRGEGFSGLAEFIRKGSYDFLENKLLFKNSFDELSAE